MPRRSRNEDSPRSARAVRLPGTSREVITRGAHPSGAEGVPVTSRSRIDASSASDAEVKAAYRELKSSYKGDRYKRRLFRKYGRNLGKAMRSDHRRSRLYMLRKAKWLSILMFLYGGYLGFSNGIFVFPMRDSEKLFIEYVPLWVRGNLQGFFHYLPDVAPIVVGLFALGVVVYVCSVLAMKVGDRGIKRRLMVHAMQESVSERDVELFRAGFCGNRRRKLLYGKTSVFSIRDAASSTTLNDYLRSMSPGPKYR